MTNSTFLAASHMALPLSPSTLWGKWMDSLLRVGVPERGHGRALEGDQAKGAKPCVRCTGSSAACACEVLDGAGHMDSLLQGEAGRRVHGKGTETAVIKTASISGLVFALAQGTGLASAFS